MNGHAKLHWAAASKGRVEWTKARIGGEELAHSLHFAKYFPLLPIEDPISALHSGGLPLRNPVSRIGQKGRCRISIGSSSPAAGANRKVFSIYSLKSNQVSNSLDIPKFRSSLDTNGISKFISSTSGAKLQKLSIICFKGFLSIYGQVALLDVPLIKGRNWICTEEKGIITIRNPFDAPSASSQKHFIIRSERVFNVGLNNRSPESNIIRALGMDKDRVQVSSSIAPAAIASSLILAVSSLEGHLGPNHFKAQSWRKKTPYSARRKVHSGIVLLIKVNDVDAEAENQQETEEELRHVRIKEKIGSFRFKFRENWKNIKKLKCPKLIIFMRDILVICLK